MEKKLEKAGFHEQQYDTGEIKLNYAHGPNNGPALILIPGQSASWENYNKVLIPLSKNFEIFAIDIRGHGKSSWTTGNYTFELIGHDIVEFLTDVVKRPAIISGNSSGGLIAIWLAANSPQHVQAIIPEDPPLFSADWPRIQSEFVYYVLKSAVEIATVIQTSTSVEELNQVLQKIEVLRKGKDHPHRLPRWATKYAAKKIRQYQHGAINSPQKKAILSGKLKKIVDALSHYDPDFSRAWVDGRIYKGLNHTECLTRISCPMLLMHANWFRHPKYGLSGAMDASDAECVCKLVPHCQYRRIDSAHVIHSDKSGRFIQELANFTKNLS